MRNMTDHALKKQGIPISSIAALVDSLGSEDAEVRREARELLAARRGEALPHLITQLASPKEHNRWEAAKTLSVIKHPGSVEALVATLRDRDEDVRWVAAEGLISIGESSLEPLLRELAFRYDSVEFRTGATHILHALSSVEHFEEIRPVLGALQKNILSYELPAAAFKAWVKFRKSQTAAESM